MTALTERTQRQHPYPGQQTGMDPRLQKKGLHDRPVRKECDIPGKCRYGLLNHHDFVVDEKYVPVKAIGKGAYGLVCSAENRETKEKVAIKKIAGAFCNDVDAIRTLREINLLRHIKHENVIAIRDIMSPTNEKFEDVYIVYDCMDTDLHQIIKSSQPLSDDHFQFFIWQVRGVVPGGRGKGVRGVTAASPRCQWPGEISPSCGTVTILARSALGLVCCGHVLPCHHLNLLALRFDRLPEREGGADQSHDASNVRYSEFWRVLKLATMGGTTHGQASFLCRLLAAVICCVAPWQNQDLG